MMNRKTQWQMLAMATLVAGLGWIGTAQAELLVYEGFDYTAGSNVVGQTGGDGWLTGDEAGWFNNAADGGTDGNPTINDGGLSYGSLQVSGNAVIFSDTGRQKIYRDTMSLDSYYDAGEAVYASFLAKNVGSYEYKMFFGDLAGDDGVGWTMDWSGKAWDVKTGSGLSEDIGETEDSTVTNLFVLGVEIVSDDGGEDRTANLSFWINPTSLGGSAPAADASFTNVAVGLDPIDSYFSEDPDALLDEIRIGTTYADVTPIPEPATLALLSLGGLAMIRRRSNH